MKANFPCPLEVIRRCSRLKKKKKKGKTALVNNYRRIPILNTFSKIFEIIIPEHVSHHFTSKFIPRQHGFVKSKSTSTNLVAYLYVITPLVHPQLQDDAIYFDFSNSFDLVPHAVLLRQLDDFGRPPTEVTWFHSYPTNRKCQVRYRGALSAPYEVLPAVPQRIRTFRPDPARKLSANLYDIYYFVCTVKNS